MTGTDPLEFLALLQSEAENGFHKKLKCWVDDQSSVAIVLKELSELV